MLKNKKVIIFDMDGTLIDSVWIWNSIDEELIKKVGTISLGDENIGKQRDDVLKKLKNEPDSYLAYCDFLREKYKSNLTKEEIKKIRYEIAEDILTTKVKFKPNAVKLLKYLKEKGFILAIASTTLKHNIEIYTNKNMNLLKEANLKDLCSMILTKNDVTEAKPSPEVHEKIMEHFNVKPEECLVVEDALIGVEAAKNAGIEVAVIYDKYADADRDKINELADYTFDDFSQMLEQVENEV